MDDNKEFKDGLKATSLFGGVQFFNIIIRIIQSKCIAVLLGPAGMGIYGLLHSMTLVINGFTGFGLGVSAVKDISEAHVAGDNKRIARTLSVLKKLVWITGGVGVAVCLFFSPVLSVISFGTYDYTLSFAAISITLLFMQLTAGWNAQMQGTRKFPNMAKATVFGSASGVLISIPLYWVWGTKGIVPAIILSTLITMVFSWYFSKKNSFAKVKMTFKEARNEGGTMAKMGFYISVQSMLSLCAGYIMRAYISHHGGLEDVGLFVAGFTMIDTYVGMIYTAMGTDYYPRLAAKSKKNTSDFNTAINQQMEISLIFISPMICIFLVFGNYAISLLYSEKFLTIEMMLCVAMLSNYFKAPGWSIAFSFLAKGDTKAFMINELFAITTNTVIKIVFYCFWGLTGVGVGFLVSYIIYLLQVNTICRYRYNYSFNKNYLKSYIPQTALGFGCFSIFVFTPPPMRYSIGIIIISCALMISYKQLQRRVNLREVVIRKFKRW